MAQLREISAKRPSKTKTTNANNTLELKKFMKKMKTVIKNSSVIKRKTLMLYLVQLATRPPLKPLLPLAATLINFPKNVSSYINWGCTALNTGNTIANIIAGMKLYSTIKNFLTIMESPSKVIAGDGQTSGFNELANEMTKNTLLKSKICAHRVYHTKKW